MYVRIGRYVNVAQLNSEAAQNPEMIAKTISTLKESLEKTLEKNNTIRISDIVCERETFATHSWCEFPHKRNYDLEKCCEQHPECVKHAVIDLEISCFCKTASKRWMKYKLALEEAVRQHAQCIILPKFGSLEKH